MSSDRTLAAVAHRVERTGAVHGDTDIAADVAESRPFHLDDLGALVGEQRHRVRTGERDREVDHLHP
jgi:hypothetical protein